jgi:cell division protein FtsI/penicillin-binding protein 2
MKASAAVAALVLAASVLAGCGSKSSLPPEQEVAQQFLSELGKANTTGASVLTTDPGAAAPVMAAFVGALRQGDDTAKVSGALDVTSLSGRTASAATAQFSATWTVPGVTQKWIYTGALPMTKSAPATGGKSAWLVNWATSDLHPKLGTGSSISIVRTQAPRADLDDSAGTPIFTSTAVVTVGVVPNQMTDVPGEAATLAAALGISAADIVTDVQAALPARGDQFLEVVTVRRTEYEQVRDQIYDLPGVQFPTGTRLLAPSATFARQLLGTVGPATAELIAASKGRLGPGDQSGVGGIQQAEDTQLGGTAGLDIQIVNADGTPGDSIGTFGAPKAGTPLQLTLNSAAQTAADGALASIAPQASIVAVQPSTGKILAVANSAAATDDIALTGQYPPGSTFKIITATAALASIPGLTPDTAENCPGTITLNGQQFENEDQFALGAVDLRTAFAQSCNTTFIALGSSLPVPALPSAAGLFGVGADWSLPVDAFSGQVPTPATPNEQAADSIGQGKVLMSPLAMAMVAAQAQSGRPVTPSLLVGAQGTPGAPLPAATVSALQDMMRAVVTSGTASGLSSLPGDVAGKTGTAEYGTDVPPRAHSWFVGYRGDLAFAVFVYDGQNAGITASSVAKTFLTAYPA